MAVKLRKLSYSDRLFFDRMTRAKLIKFMYIRNSLPFFLQNLWLRLNLQPNDAYGLETVHTYLKEETLNVRLETSHELFINHLADYCIYNSRDPFPTINVIRDRIVVVPPNHSDETLTFVPITGINACWKKRVLLIEHHENISVLSVIKWFGTRENLCIEYITSKYGWMQIAFTTCEFAAKAKSLLDCREIFNSFSKYCLLAVRNLDENEDMKNRVKYIKSLAQMENIIITNSTAVTVPESQSLSDELKKIQLEKKELETIKDQITRVEKLEKENKKLKEKIEILKLDVSTQTDHIRTTLVNESQNEASPEIYRDDGKSTKKRKKNKAIKRKRR